MRCFLFLLVWSLTQLSGVETAPLDVRAYGATGDGTTKDTEAIHKAIAAAVAAGGGVVRFPAGRYLTGTVQLQSKVRLVLEQEAVILGSPDAQDYPPVGSFHDGLGVLCNRVLISGREIEDAGITGAGTIDGQGDQLQRIRPRPFLVRFENCKRVELGGVTLMRSAMWTCHLWGSEGVNVHDVTILPTNGAHNNDGIDIDASSDVVIKNCTITCTDDAICFKATVNKPCRRVTITGCTMNTLWNGFKIGTESLGDFEDITMEHCTFARNTKGGIRIYSVDGANIRRIRVEDITFGHASLPVYIRLGARLKTFTKGAESKGVGSISDVLLKNLRGETFGQGGILITGIPGHPVTNVRIEDIQVNLPGGDDGLKASTPMAERENSYPEPYTIFGPLSAWGIILRHVQDVTITAPQLTCRKPDQRPAVACIDARGVRLENPRFTNPAQPAPTDLVLAQCPPDGVTWTGWQPVVGEAPVPPPTAAGGATSTKAP